MFFGVLCFFLFTVTGSILIDNDDEAASFISRQEWSAKPPIGSPESLNLPVHYVIISHTQTTLCNTTFTCKLWVKFQQRLDIDILKKDDIEYAFLIGGDGNIYVGRGWHARGIHAPGWNDKSLGIAFLGTFNDFAPNQKMLIAARKLLDFGKAKGYLSDDLTVLGHRQVSDVPGSRKKLNEVIKTWPEWASFDSVKTDTPKNIPPNNESISELHFIERQSWLARPPSRKIESLTLPIRYVIISHTAHLSCNSQITCSIRTRIVQTLQVENNGMDDIGYSFLIGGDGNIFVGRGWQAYGGHTPGWNDKSLGIAFIGTFNDIAPSPKMLAAARNLLEIGKAKGYLSNDLTVLVQDVSETLSPGRSLYNIIKTWPEWKPLESSKIDIVNDYPTNDD